MYMYGAYVVRCTNILFLSKLITLVIRQGSLVEDVYTNAFPVVYSSRLWLSQAGWIVKTEIMKSYNLSCKTERGNNIPPADLYG